VSVDPDSGANFNSYWYANDNPYRYVDPDGRKANDQSQKPQTVDLPPNKPPGCGTFRYCWVGSDGKWHMTPWPFDAKGEGYMSRVLIGFMNTNHKTGQAVRYSATLLAPIQPTAEAIGGMTPAEVKAALKANPTTLMRPNLALNRLVTIGAHTVAVTAAVEGGFLVGNMINEAPFPDGSGRTVETALADAIWDSTH
jgi:hypothetical protein